MKVLQFNKPVCRDVQAAVLAALASVEQEYGIKIERDGSARFDDGSFTFKLKATVADPERAATNERNEFLSYCRLFDFRPEHYGVTISVQGKQLQFVGIAPKRIKYPLKMKDLATGKVTLWTDTLRDRIVAASAGRCAPAAK